jgi:hypothetical protein
MITGPLPKQALDLKGPSFWQKRTDKINWYVCHPLFKGLDEWTLRLIFAKVLENT